MPDSGEEMHIEGPPLWDSEELADLSSELALDILLFQVKKR